MRRLSLILSLAITTFPLAAQSRARPTGTIIASNMSDNTATLIDATTDRVLATLPTGNGPHEVATSRDGRWAVVSNYGPRGAPGSSITVIDVAKRSIARTLDISPHQRPHGMKFMPGDTMLIVTSETTGELLLIDVRDGHTLRAIPTNGRAPHMIGLSANGAVAVTGNIGSGTIGVVSALTNDSTRTIRVAAQPEGVALSPDGATAWAGSNRDSVVLVVDIGRGVAVDTLRGFGLPYRTAISPDGARAVITDPILAQVRIVDAKTHKELHRLDITRDSLVATSEVPGSPSPEGVTISNDSRWAFVTLQGRNRVITIDLASGTIVGWAPTGTWSDGVAFSPLGGSR